METLSEAISSYSTAKDLFQNASNFGQMSSSVSSALNSFNVNSFQQQIGYSRTMAEEVGTALIKTTESAAKLMDAMSKGDPRLRTMWETLRNTLNQISDKYNEKTNALINLLNAYERETVENNTYLYSKINEVDSALQHIIKRLSSL